MLTYELVARRGGFACLTGMGRAAFDALFEDFRAAEAERLGRRTRRGAARRRSPGAGRKAALDARTRLLLALVWLRVYPTYRLLGLLFDAHEGHAHRLAGDALATLGGLADFGFERPDPSRRRRLDSPDRVMAAFPDVRLVIDTREQRVRRPGGGGGGGAWERQKPYYSMKKKAHALKHQLAVAPHGRAEHVGASVPGGSAHDRTPLRRRSGLPDDPPATGQGADGGQGVRRDAPRRVPAAAAAGHARAGPARAPAERRGEGGQPRRRRPPGRGRARDRAAEPARGPAADVARQPRAAQPPGPRRRDAAQPPHRDGPAEAVCRRVTREDGDGDAQPLSLLRKTPIDDDLLRTAKRMAAERSVPVDQVISDLIRKGLDQSLPYEIRDGFPVFRVPPGAKTFDLEDVRRVEDEP